PPSTGFRPQRGQSLRPPLSAAPMRLDSRPARLRSKQKSLCDEVLLSSACRGNRRPPLFECPPPFFTSGFGPNSAAASRTAGWETSWAENATHRPRPAAE
ncbi:hypothetical protein TcCL_NonESM07626, partial [Trypanosoma cruzi]